ncbi:unnamed protein product [Meganyctiphanes norvegica]|uniref:Uncharacterized protein n=1 Tax=Meganyctiphanes norvegica TaxID=48144 RepID=A0AAV2Q6W6_MEGNR
MLPSALLGIAIIFSCGGLVIGNVWGDFDPAMPDCRNICPDKCREQINTLGNEGMCRNNINGGLNRRRCEYWCGVCGHYPGTFFNRQGTALRKKRNPLMTSRSMDHFGSDTMMPSRRWRDFESFGRFRRTTFTDGVPDVCSLP